MTGRSCAWALVPARGGSKSIPGKNLVRLAGKPLLDYGARAAQASERFARIVCSTDDAVIAAHAHALAMEISNRPAVLSGDDAKVADVARDFLATERAAGRGMPDILALVQPTSPFLLPAHVHALLDAMTADGTAQSGQTVTPCPHNHHAWNQRVVADGHVRFHFSSERKRAYNKQTKPTFYVFGNLVAIRTAALMAGEDFFAEPSVAVEIGRPYDFDLDVAEDVALAEAIIASGGVVLSHMTMTAERSAATNRN